MAGLTCFCQLPTSRSGCSSIQRFCAASSSNQAPAQKSMWIVCSRLKRPAPVRQPPLLSAEELQSKFGGPFLEFRSIGDLTVAEMRLKSGGTARVLLEQARVTSFKHCMWHGGVEELLYTDVVTQDGDQDEQFLVNGGISPLFCHQQQPQCSLFAQGNWRLESVKVDPDNYIQVTLRCPGQTAVTDDAGHYLRSVISISKEALASAVVISNNGQTPITFTGSISTQLSVSTVEAINAFGLNGCRFYSPSEAARPIQAEDISLIGKVKSFFWPTSGNVRAEKLKSTPEDGKTMSSTEVQTNWFIQRGLLTPFKTISHRIYSNPPKSTRISDEGLRRSLLFSHEGFDEIVLANPEPAKPESDMQESEAGSFVSISAGSLLSPIVLKPGEFWRGAQILVPDS